MCGNVWVMWGIMCVLCRWRWLLLKCYRCEAVTFFAMFYLGVGVSHYHHAIDNKGKGRGFIKKNTPTIDHCVVMWVVCGLLDEFRYSLAISLAISSQSSPSNILI